MNKNLAISIKGVSKKFKLYKSNKDRAKEIIHPLRAKYHREYWALDGIDFDVKKGCAVGILGRNGSGKSTLLQIIASIMQATAGSVYIDGRVSALLELGAGFNPLFTGRDNAILNGVIQGISEKDMITRLPEIESFADIGEFFYQPVGTYSSGMFIRLAFAAATSIDPDIILVDEALAVGDAKFQHKCFNKFQEYIKKGKTVIVVSHETDTLLRFCDSGIVLEEGKVLFKGDIVSAVNTYQEVLYGKINHKERKHPENKEINSSGINGLSEDRLFFGKNANLSVDNCQNNPGYNCDETRIGDNRAVIVNYDITVEDNLNPPVIKYGEEFKIKMTILFKEDIENVHFGFAIVTKESIYVHGTNTQMQHVMPISGKVNEIVIIEFCAQAIFVGGDYFINLGIFSSSDGELEYIDTRRSIGRITFSETDWCRGFVAFPPKCTIRERKSAASC